MAGNRPAFWKTEWPAVWNSFTHAHWWFVGTSTFPATSWSLLVRPRPPGGAHIKILTGMLVLFFWVWNFAKSYFSGLAIFLAIFLGFAKFPLFFGVWQISSCFFGSSNFCITHLNPLNEEHTVLKNKIIFIFIFIQTLTTIASWFILFFWVWILGHSIFWVWI